MMMGSSDGLGILMPIQLNQVAVATAEMVATSGGGGGGGGSPQVRVPQWSQQETRDFIEIRGELERDFIVSKRNKTLWDVVATRMKERGYLRSPDQCKCKWKNLVNRYKGKETSDPDSNKQCPFFEELHAVFTEQARSMQLLESETGNPSHSRKKLKRSSEDKSSYELSDDEEEDDVDSDLRTQKRKSDRVQQLPQQRGDKLKAANSNLHDLLQVFFQQQQQSEALWRDSVERRAEERRMFELEWRKSMENLERERLMLEQAWKEREEQRRIREESRAIKRDALLTTLLNKIIQEDL